MEIAEIECLSPWEEVNPENDNVDVHVHLADGRIYSFVVATPNNIFWCMDNEDLDYYYGLPMLFVNTLTKTSVAKLMHALFSDPDTRWVAFYGTLQGGSNIEQSSS